MLNIQQYLLFVNSLFQQYELPRARTSGQDLNATLGDHVAMSVTYFPKLERSKRPQS